MLSSSVSAGRSQLLRLLQINQFRGTQPAHGQVSTGGITHFQVAFLKTDTEPAHLVLPPETQKQVIYKGRWILPFRLLVRAKVFQLLAASGAAVAASTVFFKEDATTLEIAGVTALAAGCIVASTSLWYFSRRYVGELSLLLPDRTTARFSVLDFWGNREDVDVPIDRIQPPFKDKHPLVVQRICSQMAFPVSVTGERQFFLSVGGGQATDKELLMKLLKGELQQGTRSPLQDSKEGSTSKL